MNKKNLMPVIVLTVICVAVALVLGVVNAITAPMIREKNEKAIQESLSKVMLGGEFNPEPDALKEGAPETVSKVYTEKNGKGTVVVLVTKKGYTKKEIGLTVGIDAEGKITGMTVTKNEESIIPPELKPGGAYGDSYVGAGPSDVPELETGATVSFTESAIKNAINDAFVYLGFAAEKPELPRDEAEIEALAKAFYNNPDAKLVSSRVEDGKYVKRIYKENGKNSYVVYAFNYSERYGTPEFEFLVHVGEDGAIKAVKKILWKVSDPKPEWGYVPPSDDEVDAFFESFVSKNSETVTSVDVETGATNTSTLVREAFAEALSYSSFVANVNYAPRIVGIVIISLAVIGSAGAVIFNRKRRKG